MATTIELKNSVTTGNSPSTLAQGEMGVNITDKKVWIGNASSTPIQLIGAGASMSLTSLTTSSDASISGLTVGKGLAGGASNTALGFTALSATTSGVENTGVGSGALQAVTSGSSNTAVGRLPLLSNTTGGSNTAIGTEALRSNTTASNNTAVGYQAGYSNTTGTELTAIGFKAAYSQTTPANSYNVAVGNYALYQNQTGTQNTVVGWNSLANVASSNNTALGYQAGTSINTGAGNTTIGYSAGSNITTGGYNIYIGPQAIASASNVNQEIVLGTNYTSSIAGKGSNTGYIYPNGGGVYQGNNSATWSITSDARLKKNIVNNTTGLDAISQIQVRNFEYRTKDEITDLPNQNAININGVQLGAIAQELKEILPECVKTESTGVMSVDTTNLTWYLINAVKELNAKITALENK